MNIVIRKANAGDIDAVSEIYEHIHTAEEQGKAVIGWIRGIYPERETAEAALSRGDLFVEEAEGRIVGTAIINQIQVDTYKKLGYTEIAVMPCVFNGIPDVQLVCLEKHLG